MKISLQLKDATNFAEATGTAKMSYDYEACPAPPSRVADLLNAEFKTTIFSSDGVNGKRAGVKIKWPRNRSERKPIKVALKAGIELDVEPAKTFRAGGDTICDACGKKYYDHPTDEEDLSYTGDPVYLVLCNGDRVKL